MIYETIDTLTTGAVILDLTDKKPNHLAPTASNVAVPVTRHQLTLIASGTDAAIGMTITVMPSNSPGFEEVLDGSDDLPIDGQVTFIIRDALLDKIKISVDAGTISPGGYTVKYTGYGDYKEA